MTTDEEDEEYDSQDRDEGQAKEVDEASKRRRLRLEPTGNGSWFVYGVHAVRPEQVSTTVLVTSTKRAAEEHAAALSKQPAVLAGAVTRFVLDTLGDTTSVALFVAGVRQQVPYVSDDRCIQANARAPYATPRL